MKLCVAKTESIGKAQRDLSLLESAREFECELEGDIVKINLESLKLALEIVRYSHVSSLVLVDNEIIRGPKCHT